MHRLIFFVLSVCLLATTVYGQGRPARKPAPPESRYTYTLEFDKEKLPPGIEIRTVSDNLGTRHFIKNTSDKPLDIDLRHQGDRLAGGKRLVSGAVLMYFPNGVPVAGKQHLKGWQSPFGKVEETIIGLPRPPAKIYEGRNPATPAVIPPAERTEIKAEYDGKPYAIPVTIRYGLNPKFGK